MVEIQSHILKRRKKNTFSRLLGKKADNRAIAAWRSDLDRIRSVVEVLSITSAFCLPIVNLLPPECYIQQDHEEHRDHRRRGWLA